MNTAELHDPREAEERDATEPVAALERGVVPCAEYPLTQRVEALLLSTDRPLTDGKIAELLGVTLEAGGTKAIREAIESLNAIYVETGRTFRIEAVAGGRQMLTQPQFGPVLHRLHQSRLQSRLTPAAMETLAIIAYRQPVLRTEIEAIRGVASGEVVRTLMERRLVTIVGRAEEIGRPMLYGTTREFLRVFGLSSLDDLPQAKELRIPGVKKNPVKKNEGAGSEPDAQATHADPAAGSVAMREQARG